VQIDSVKKCKKNWTECSLACNRFPIRFVSFFISSLCLLVRVTMVDKNKAVVCCLLASSAIMLSEKKKRKRKMWSKKWYLKRNISCDAHLLNELSTLRWCHRGVGRWTEETVGFAEWTVQFSVRKTTGKDSSRACAIACQNCAVYSVFPSGITSHSKIAQYNWESNVYWTVHHYNSWGIRNQLDVPCDIYYT
jgi:hypothetical protein